MKGVTGEAFIIMPVYASQPMVFWSLNGSGVGNK